MIVGVPEPTEAGRGGRGSFSKRVVVASWAELFGRTVLSPAEELGRQLLCLHELGFYSHWSERTE